MSAIVRFRGAGEAQAAALTTTTVTNKSKLLMAGPRLRRYQTVPP
jgi:hypothetical protein